MPPELTEILKYLGGGAGFLGIFYILVKTGLLKMQIGGNGQDMGKIADSLKKNHFHEWGDDIKDLKTRMGRIESEISEIKGDIGYLRGRLNGK